MFNYICWSIVTMCTGAAKDFTGLILARFFLGVFEATILPSFVLITQVSPLRIIARPSLIARCGGRDGTHCWLWSARSR
jgi:hypothetical protein